MNRTNYHPDFVHLHIACTLWILQDLAHHDGPCSAAHSLTDQCVVHDSRKLHHQHHCYSTWRRQAMTQIDADLARGDGRTDGHSRVTVIFVLPVPAHVLFPHVAGHGRAPPAPSAGCSQVLHVLWQQQNPGQLTCRGHSRWCTCTGAALGSAHRETCLHVECLRADGQGLGLSPVNLASAVVHAL